MNDPGFFLTYSMIQLVVMLLLIRFADPYEREPMSAIWAMALWGGTGAVAIGLAGNQLLAKVFSSQTNQVFGSALTAPLVEEIGKGLALVAAFALSRFAAPRFGTFELDGVTDGIVYGAAVGIGFSFTENVFYFMRSLSGGNLEAALGVFQARAGFLGLGMLGHAVYTGTFGAGLGLATWSRRRRERIIWPVAGFFAAVAMHAVFNGLAQLIVVARFGFSEVAAFYCVEAGGPSCPALGRTAQIEGGLSSAGLVVDVLDKLFVAGFLVMIIAWVRYQRRVIREELIESAEAGLCPLKEAEVVARYWRRNRWYLHLIRRGHMRRVRLLRDIHAMMVELALTKRRLRRIGPDARWGRVAELRERISALRKAAQRA